MHVPQQHRVPRRVAAVHNVHRGAAGQPANNAGAAALPRRAALHRQTHGVAAPHEGCGDPRCRPLSLRRIPLRDIRASGAAARRPAREVRPRDDVYTQRRRLALTTAAAVRVQRVGSLPRQEDVCGRYVGGRQDARGGARSVSPVASRATTTAGGARARCRLASLATGAGSSARPPATSLSRGAPTRFHRSVHRRQRSERESRRAQRRQRHGVEGGDERRQVPRRQRSKGEQQERRVGAANERRGSCSKERAEGAAVRAER